MRDRVDSCAGLGRDQCRQALVQAAGLERTQRVAQPRCGIGDRHEFAPQILRQAAQQGHQLVLQVSRHQPLQPPRRQRTQERKRHLERHAVVGIGRVEPVAERQRVAVHLELIGVVTWIDRRGRSRQHHVHRYVEAMGMAPFLAAPPALERARARHIGRDALEVEIDQRIIRGQQVAAAQLRFELLHPGPHARIAFEEPAAQRGLPAQQRLLDEHATRERRVDRREVDLPAAAQHAPVQRDRFAGHHHASRGDPLRLTVGSPHQV